MALHMAQNNNEIYHISKLSFQEIKPILQLILLNDNTVTLNVIKCKALNLMQIITSDPAAM